MKISKDQMQNLIGAVAKTFEHEISCQTCEEQLALFAELQLTGAEIPKALKKLEAHLEICPECTEELAYLKRALEADESR